MQIAPFTVQEIERTIEFELEGEDYTDEHDPGLIDPADFREALDALESDHWDSMDVRADGTIICYPADMNQDYRTGAWTSTQVIVKARRPEWADRLLNVYESRKRRDN